MKRLIPLLSALLLLPALALARPAEILQKTLEETTERQQETLSFRIDRWCYTYKKAELRFFVAHVWPTRVGQLLTAFAGEQYSKKATEPTSVIAARHGAVLAINGDYYNYKDGYGLILRNGVLYRDKPSTRDHLLVYEDGRMEGLPAADYAAGQGEALLLRGVFQSFCFGPLLVDGGAAVPIPEKYFLHTEDDIREPRTAIGQAEDGHYVLLVADGRRDGWSDQGMTLQELQQVMLEEGCRVAYNLDGGGSATLVLDGLKINRSSGSREREVSDILYFIP